jgi:hypothetical protein
LVYARKEIPSATLVTYKVTPEMWNPKFDSPATIETYVPPQTSFLTNGVESDVWRWRD